MAKRKRLRIAYLSGSVDAREVYDNWTKGREQPYFGTSYLSQFFELCRELGADGYVLTTLPGRHAMFRCGDFLIENRPMPREASGVRYHMGIAFWYLRLAPRLLRSRPDLLVVTALQNHWFLLFFLKWLGVTVVPAVHCVFWPMFRPIRWHWRALFRLNRQLFWSRVTHAIAASEEIASQIRKLATCRVTVFLPTYDRSQFDGVNPPLPGKPFRVFFAGRIVENKGVYDLLAIAHRLELEAPGEFRFDICGDGSELEPMRRSALPRNFVLHGFCSAPRLRSVLSESHAVIVPTRTTCDEGFNMVCAEAILAGRPLITSAVCPALATVRAAAIEVPPDDVDAYYEAILRLRSDRQLYEEKRRACALLQQQFYDPANGWAARLREALDGRRETRKLK